MLFLTNKNIGVILMVNDLYSKNINFFLSNNVLINSINIIFCLYNFIFYFNAKTYIIAWSNSHMDYDLWFIMSRDYNIIYITYMLYMAWNI